MRMRVRKGSLRVSVAGLRFMEEEDVCIPARGNLKPWVGFIVTVILLS